MRIASIPACSSPMKVREAPVTPWTMAMLPASRLDNCAKEQRRADITHQPLVEEGALIGLVRDLRQDLAIDLVVPLATAGTDDQVSYRP